VLRPGSLRRLRWLAADSDTERTARRFPKLTA
jgi:hypothetical protein